MSQQINAVNNNGVDGSHTDSQATGSEDIGDRLKGEIKKLLLSNQF